MERREYEKLKIGDIVYLFKLEISYQHHINLGIAAELKKTGDDEFKVTQVINGKLLKVGDLVKIDDKNWRSRFRTSNLWAKLEEGIGWWNAKIRNAEDGLTSQYEKRKKGLTKRLIQV
jgi:hypothetical protein